MNLSKSLGNLHNEFAVFSKADFSKNDNILDTLIQFQEFDYLSSFYKEYQSEITNEINEKIGTEHAKSKDLPFIGKSVIENQNAKFIIYFEGSLSDVKKLSITVLAQLWLTDNQDIISAFCGKNLWWTKGNYKNIRSKLNFDSNIVSNSYVTDSVRFEDDVKNTALIYKEIELLKPKLVICVGKKARELVGMKYLKLDTKFHFVRFPKYHSNNEIYTELIEILKEIE